MVKFAHIADVHIGSWRDDRMRTKSVEALTKAIDACLDEKIDFLIIAGDFFNTALPPIDLMKRSVEQLMRLRREGIPIYVVAGSHDYSASGKTMLDVLEETGVFVNVMRGEVIEGKLRLAMTTDERTGIKLCGILGKANMLDKSYYEAMDRAALESSHGQGGKRVFVFHAGINELLPSSFEHMAAMPLSLLPRGFDYYAGGHVHIRKAHTEEGYGPLVYPGPLFPADFQELEDLGQGSFVIVDNFVPTFHEIVLHPTVSIRYDVTGKTATQIQDDLFAYAKEPKMHDALVTVRLKGKLHEGDLTALELKKVVQSYYDAGAYFVMRNTGKVEVKQFDEVSVSVAKDDVERMLIKEHAHQQPMGEDAQAFISDLMAALDVARDEGERVTDFHDRIFSSAREVLKQAK